VRVDYTGLIAESEEELRELEQQHRGKRTAVRIQALRLLRSGQVSSLRAVAPLVGYSYRQVQQWWYCYRDGGMEGLLHLKPHLGKPSRLTEEAFTALAAEMAAGKIATLKDVQTYLKEQWGIVYHSLNGVWLQLHKRRAKPKTGRRRHRKADAEAQTAFKQTSPSS
jgi:putative transposase